MKIRYYRGPLDGKVKNLAVQGNYIKVSIPNTKPDWLDVGTDAYIDPSKFKAHKMYNEYIYRRTQHTHPDGSVFFEWDQPRGTKF